MAEKLKVSGQSPRTFFQSPALILASCMTLNLSLPISESVFRTIK
jgi:hypothetical protein